MSENENLKSGGRPKYNLWNLHCCYIEQYLSLR